MVWLITNSIRQVTIIMNVASAVLLSLHLSSVWYSVIMAVPVRMTFGTVESFSPHVSPSLCIFHLDYLKDPERRERNPFPGRVDGDRDYPLFLLHIQPAPPPSVLHQMGQVQRPDHCVESDITVTVQDIVSGHVGLFWCVHFWHASLTGLAWLYLRK